MGSGITENGSSKVETITIDELYKKNKRKFDGSFSILKMDVEGSELKTLQGAAEFIREQKPMLSVCVYHKMEDIIELPRFIMEIDPSYKLYFRRYAKGFRDTVLYAM